MAFRILTHGILAQGGIDVSFISVWKTTTPSESFTLPIVSAGTYDFIVDWGDGSERDHITVWNEPDATHVYTTPGNYTIKMESFSSICPIKFNSYFIGLYPLHINFIYCFIIIFYFKKRFHPTRCLKKDFILFNNGGDNPYILKFEIFYFSIIVRVKIKY